MVLLKKSVAVLAMSAISSVYLLSASANQPNRHKIEEAITVGDEVDGIIGSTYNSIDFGTGEKLNQAIFSAAMHGYLNLKNAGKLNTDKQVLTIADFTLSSNQDRLWVIDLVTKKVLFHSYVAHGQGSGDEFATSFSNSNNSHQSSIGFYVTGDTYEGEHGNSLRLYGMDNGYNSAAFDRGIVMHSADYVSKDFICNNERLGRSWGCPAVNPKLAQGIINTIKEGTCLFIYYPQKNYMRTAYWLNKKVDLVPDSRHLQYLQPVKSTAIAGALDQHDPVLRDLLPGTSRL